ncbi:MAG: glycoside hydrolase family 15 protein [Acidobacteriota bacterium]|nr:glycoside hydrolase family 15 protein [Acidobacteriota bacterium]
MSGKNPAPGGPGIEPRWTRGAKDAVGTAYAVSSRIWYTLANGTLTEVYYPTIDTPQVRDVQYLVTDGASFFHDERRHMRTELDCLDPAALGFKLINSDPEGRYSIEKVVIGDPHLNCLLVHTKFNVAPEWQGRLHLYVLCAPHMQIGGWHNNGQVGEGRGRIYLAANRGDAFLLLDATAGFLRASCGYVGVNDGWTDLSRNFRMTWQYDSAVDGNIALIGEIDLSHGNEFTLGLAFGHTAHNAATTAIQSLSIPFDQSLKSFLDQWHRTGKRLMLLDEIHEHDSYLFRRSINLLLAHEDKVYPGAMIASLSIPWGEDKSDDDLGGYHLVWTRDLVNSVTALLAAGDQATPLRALIYLAISQREDGGFYQNFWIDGRPYWTGVQLDEVSFPIILAWRLWKAGALDNFDPYITVLRACGYLIREGPATPEERWEEAGGFSPSTLASNIAGLICAAEFIDAHGEHACAEFVRSYADFLESHVERWTVTNRGTLVPGITRHYIRITPAVSDEGSYGDEDPDNSVLVLANQKPGDPASYPANQIVDAGFLELVRFGVRRADDPLIVDSLKVIDAVLKVDTPKGPCWKRYNHDGYGQRDDGGSYEGWGGGRPWPLLTGERAMYELAAGRDIDSYLLALEAFSIGIGLLPEQIWDGPDMPDKLLEFAGPTGAAIPLMWAHSEYVKLLRSTVDKRVFDLVDPVAERYRNDKPRRVIEVWKTNRQVRQIPAGGLLRIQLHTPFLLHWSKDGWKTVQDTNSVATVVGLYYVDIEASSTQTAPLVFTFHWTEENRWQGENYQVNIAAANPTVMRKAATSEWPSGHGGSG